MRDSSILYSALRSFFIALFSMAGICFAIIPIILFFSYLFSTNEISPESNYNLELLPNAEGVRKSLSSSTPVILNIDIKGEIGLPGLTQHDIRNMLVESREDPLKDNRVKAIFLNIESPGGTVVDSDGIYRALKAYKEQYKVPVYAHVDGMCASGAMYIASAADKIYASESSIIGSVGVLTPSFLNFSQLIEKVGVQALTLTAGKDKDMLNPLRQWKPGEQDILQGVINYYYNIFVDIVSTSRPKIDKQKLIDDYGAKVFPAEQAAAIGFVDASGISRNEALKMLLKDINIQDNKYMVVSMTNKNWLKAFISGQSAKSSGKVIHEIKIPGELDAALQGQYLYLYR